MTQSQKKSDLVEMIAQHVNSDLLSGSLAERLYDAFYQGLSTSRWKNGDLLPLPEDVAKIAKVSKASVSRVYQRLAKEGYILRTKRKGSEVIATIPISKSTTRIAIILCNPTNKALFRSEVYAQKLAFSCLECAKKRGFESEFVILSAEQMAKPFLESTELFGNRPAGIMSVGPAPVVKDPNGKPIPVMYIHRSANDLRPCTMGDAHSAIHRLTDRAVSAGHRNIVFMGDRDWQGESEIRWQYHRECMRKAGLEANEACFRESIKLSPFDLSEWKQWLQRQTTATCFISGSRVRVAEMLAAAAVTIGKRIPEDFSLLSYGQCTFISELGESHVVSVDHDVDFLISAGMDILHAQIRGDYEQAISLMVAPQWYDGTTFGLPHKS